MKNSKKSFEELASEINLKRPDQIKEYLDQYIIGQDEAKRTLSVAVYNHYKRIMYNGNAINKKSDVNIGKSNALIFGGTGSGKTYMLKKIAELLGVPCAITSCTTLSATGFVGSDVEDCLVNLLRATDYDVNRAQLGIVILDEVDKIAKKSAGMSITRDVSGESVQQCMLRMVDSDLVGVPPMGGRKHPEQSLIYVDTTNILFIGLGAFVGLDEIVKKRVSHTSIGFSTEKKNQETTDELLSMVTPEDLKKFGFIPEFIGRFPIFTQTKLLTKDDLKSILKEPKNSLIKQYTELLSMDGVKLKITDDAIEEIASLAAKLETGARGLRNIMETIMEDVMFEAPLKRETEGLKTYTVTLDYVIEKTKLRFKQCA